MQRKVKDILPKTFEELKALSQDERARLWARYSPHPFKRQMRPLWYYIQCERLNLRIEPKFIKKIKKYKDKPDECVNRVLKHRYNIAPGTTIIRHFRNIEHKVLVNYDNTFLYNGKQYRSLSAIASDICGAKTSGPHFFELDKRKVNVGD